MTIEDAVKRAMDLLASAEVERPPTWAIINGQLFWFCEDCGEPLELECDLSTWPTGPVECECGWTKVFEQRCAYCGVSGCDCHEPEDNHEQG